MNGPTGRRLLTASFRPSGGSAVEEKELRRLIARGESFRVEFKGEEHQKLSDDALVEAVVCLANGEGGVLLVGVEDDGRVTGARPRHEAGITDPVRVQGMIANKTRPYIAVQVELVQVGGAPVLIISVPEATSPVGTTSGKYVRRAIIGSGKPGCVPYHFHEMQARLADRGLQDYSALTVDGAAWDDLDPLEFERLRRMIRGAGTREPLVDLPDVEIAKALGVVESNHEVRAVTVGGLLLFGREEALRKYLPTHEVAFQVLDGTRVLGNEFFHGPLFRVMEEVLTRFRAVNREQEISVGFLRLGIPDYPEAGFREAVANAILHRDYARLGAVHIQFYEDYLQISNPGGFPQGVHLGNLLVAPPRPRNPRLADAFHRAGLVERTGRGIKLIYEFQLRYGRPVPDYSSSTDTDVVLVLRGGTANLAFARLVHEQSQHGKPLTLEALLVLNEVERLRRVSVARAAEVLQRSPDAASVILNRMVERGLVEARGEKGGRTYHLTAAVYRALGEPLAYTLARGFDKLQQVEMVSTHVRAHGGITRQEAAALCQISAEQAYRLLRKMVQAGELRLSGTGRKARYENAGRRP